MTRRDRSSFISEGDSPTPKLLEELHWKLEAIEKGFFGGISFSTIIRAIGDMILLLRDLLEEGDLLTQEPAWNVIIHEDPHDPLINQRDANMHVTSSRVPVNNPQVGLTPRLAEWIDKIIITCFGLAENPAADPNFMFGTEQNSQLLRPQVPVTRASLYYWKRLRKRRTKDQHKVGEKPYEE